MERKTELAQIVTSLEKAEQNTEPNHEEIQAPSNLNVPASSRIDTDLRISIGRSELNRTSYQSEDSPIRLDPLSKDFPSSIPSKDSDIYLEARENLNRPPAQLVSIVTTRDDSGYVRTNNCSNETRENICCCLLF